MFPLSKYPKAITRLISLTLVISSSLLWSAQVAAEGVSSAQATNQTSTAVAIKGYAIPIGGALRSDNDEVWERIVKLAGGKGAKFVIFGTASENPEASAKQAAENLRRRGAVVEILPIAPRLGWVDLYKATRDPTMIDKVRHAKGIFFTGGAQERIVDTLSPKGVSTPILDAIWESYRRGAVVAGTSAGAAIMSTIMFRDALAVTDVLKGRWQDGKEVDQGLGFVGANLFVDQHFLKRGRFARMIPLMVSKGYKLGLGVDENTAVVIHGDDIEVLGGSGAVVVDLLQSRTNAAQEAFNIANVRLTYLEAGDHFNFKTRVAAPADYKLRGQKLDPTEPTYKPEYTDDMFRIDMLGASALSNSMAYLIDSTRTEVSGLGFDSLPKPNDPLASLGFLFRLYKGEGSVGYYTEERGTEAYTILNIYMDISPVRVPYPFYSAWPAGKQTSKL